MQSQERFFSKVFLKFLLAIVLIMLGNSCLAQRNQYSSTNKARSAFRLQYNTLFNVDKIIDEAERGLILHQLGVHPNSLFGLINPKYFANMDAVIKKVHDLLTDVVDERRKDELYFKLGKAYFLKTDYYTALAYFNTINISSFELTVWKMKTLQGLAKMNEFQELWQNVDIKN